MEIILIILIVCNIGVILQLSYKIQQMENEKLEIYNESIKEINNLRKKEKIKNVK